MIAGTLTRGTGCCEEEHVIVGRAQVRRGVLTTY